MLLTPNLLNLPVSKPDTPRYLDDHNTLECTGSNFHWLVSPAVMVPGRKTPLPRTISGLFVAGGGITMFSCVQLVIYPPMLIISERTRRILSLFFFINSVILCLIHLFQGRL